MRDKKMERLSKAVIGCLSSFDWLAALDRARTWLAFVLRLRWYVVVVALLAK